MRRLFIARFVRNMFVEMSAFLNGRDVMPVHDVAIGKGW